jgi:hypothetical protein
MFIANLISVFEVVGGNARCKEYAPTLEPDAAIAENPEN